LGDKVLTDLEMKAWTLSGNQTQSAGPAQSKAGIFTAKLGMETTGPVFAAVGPHFSWHKDAILYP
jgi:hypothetical protein